MYVPLRFVVVALGVGEAVWATANVVSLDDADFGFAADSLASCFSMSFFDGMKSHRFSEELSSSLLLSSSLSGGAYGELIESEVEECIEVGMMRRWFSGLRCETFLWKKR